MDGRTRCSSSLTTKPMGGSRDLLPVVSSRVAFTDSVAAGDLAVGAADPHSSGAQNQVAHSQT